MSSSVFHNEKLERALVRPKEDPSAKLLCPVRGLSSSNETDVSCQACATVVAQDWDEHGYKLFGCSGCTWGLF